MPAKQKKYVTRFELEKARELKRERAKAQSEAKKLRMKGVPITATELMKIKKEAKNEEKEMENINEQKTQAFELANVDKATKSIEEEKKEEKQEAKEATSMASLRPETAAARKQRVGLGVPRLKLSAPQKRGKHRRWINDAGGRIQLAQEGGYEFVTQDMAEGQVGDPGALGTDNTGAFVSRIVGTNADGSPLTSYLMEINDEFYEADQKEKQKRLDELDEQIRGGNIEGRVGQDGRYIPKEGISYRP